MDNPLNNQRTNPRFKRTFPLTLNLEQVTVHGHAVEPSAYGCNVEINEYEYNQLISNPALWKNNRRIIVSTTI
ncbi:MAG TPA: hypothetical protein VK308_13015, partial [Pyrinomonadaceae bacterium]|nr:hypothetical protein [Pyrinomonadaceae bacterium]